MLQFDVRNSVIVSFAWTKSAGMLFTLADVTVFNVSTAAFISAHTIGYALCPVLISG